MLTLTSDMLSAWAGILIVAVGAILVGLAAMIWIVFFRKNARSHRKRRRLHANDRQQINPTLEQTGGLPPLRSNSETSRSRMPSLTTRL